jgi:hypothetical protein
VAKKTTNPWLSWAEVARAIIEVVIAILTKREPGKR